MHAVSRDTSTFPSHCIYLQLDAQHKLDGNETRAANGTAPMDVSAGHSAGTAGAGATGDVIEGQGEGQGEEEEDDNDDAPQEVRLLPHDLSGDALSGALDGLFEALSECAALNPDDGDELLDDDDDDDDDDGGAALLLAASQGAEGFVDPQAFLHGATPAQLAMLDRYDAMLDESDVVAQVHELRVDNSDGRFDDPDDEGNLAEELPRRQ